MRPAVGRRRCRVRRVRPGPGLHRRRDHRHHHTLEQIDRLARAQLLRGAAQVAEQAAAPVLAGIAPARDRPGSGRCRHGSSPIGTSPGAGRPAAFEIGVVASAGSRPATGGVVRPPGRRPVGLVSAGLGPGWPAGRRSPGSAGQTPGTEPRTVDAGLASADRSAPGASPAPVRVVSDGLARPGVGQRRVSDPALPGRSGRARSPGAARAGPR